MGRAVALLRDNRRRLRQYFILQRSLLPIHRFASIREGDYTCYWYQSPSWERTKKPPWPR
jgi:hypothetical protein